MEEGQDDVANIHGIEKDETKMNQTRVFEGWRGKSLAADFRLPSL